MKKVIISIVLALTLTLKSKAQLGTTLYLSPYFTSVGVLYEFDKVMRPEIRFGSDRGFFTSSNIIQVNLCYDIVNKTDYEFYAGLGLIFLESSGGWVVPIGFNIYPFENKQMGLHIEASTFLDGIYTSIIPTWGFRYKLSK